MTAGERSGTRPLEAAVVAILILLGAMMIVGPIVVSDGDYLHDPLFWIGAVGLVFVLGVLAISRSGHTVLAAHLFVAFAFALVWAFAFAAHGSDYLIGNFAYVTVVVLLAAFYLPPHAVLLYAIGNVLGVVAVQETFGLSRSDQITSYLYIALFSGLLYAVAQQKDLEHRRREEATRRVERMRTEATTRDYQVAILNRAAHRLQTPLMPLIMRMDTLEARSADWDPTDREALEAAHHSLIRLKSTVGDFLEAARLAGGTHLADARTQPVRPVLEDAAARFQEQRPNHIRIGITAPDDLEVYWDAGRVRMLLLALLENAADANQKGAEVQVRAIARDGGVLLSVLDHGTGLDDDQRDALTRFLASEDRTSNAAGLGLLLVRAVAEGHGTTVRFVSAEPGEGTEFSVWFLPATETDGT